MTTAESNPFSCLRTGAGDAAGDRSAAVGHNAGIVQTGDSARVLGNAVSLGIPGDVSPPEGGLVGLPRPPRRVFVGRVEQLDELGGLVKACGGVVIQAVHGLGGVGKSELALQYAHRHRIEYSLVWWVQAETPEAAEAGLAQLAFRLQPAVQVIATQAEAATWALAWLQCHDGWLLVLDNVEDRSLVEPLLGQMPSLSG
jgi:hypothetical protein